jgi:hypothetical protein
MITLKYQANCPCCESVIDWSKSMKTISMLFIFKKLDSKNLQGISKKPTTFEEVD